MGERRMLGGLWGAIGVRRTGGRDECWVVRTFALLGWLERAIVWWTGPLHQVGQGRADLTLCTICCGRISKFFERCDIGFWR